ncbi:MAG: SDR family oxidoreductase [Rhodospirillaceae bacterium]|nr:SDR family oxidoreductase [Rhodospirillaceae bacterium]
MDLGIKGERALVLGGTQGLAFSAAKFLHRAGVKLAVNGRAAQHGEAAVKALGEGAHFVAGDVSDATQAVFIHERAEKALGGPVSILVTNAGGPPPGQFLEHDEAAWHRAIETNMLSALRMARLVLPEMIAAGWGRIVNVTSIAVREPFPNLVLSNGVRLGLTGAMSTIAREVADRGITINNVLPGLMDTGALARVYKAQSLRQNISQDEAKRRMAESVPMKRLGAADDFGPAVAFLCSRHAAYITAQNLTVDGGLAKGVL